jgi:hypothetical protein
VIVAMLLCATLALAPSAHARSEPPAADFFGLNVEGLFSGNFAPSYVWPSYVSTFTRGGIQTGRTPAFWDRIEPNAPNGGNHSYNWEVLDRTAETLARFHARMTIILMHSPAWASSGAYDGAYAVYPPRDPNDFGVFAQAVVARYGPNGSFWRARADLPRMAPVSYEIWNEENHSYYYRPAPDPAGYVRIYNAARSAIRQLDPNANVVVGGVVWNDDAQFIRGLYNAGGAGWQPDGIALHPYATTVIGTVINLRRVYQTLQSLGQHPPLYLTELGWWAAQPGDPGATDTTQGPMADTTRAGVLSMLADAAVRSDCNIESVMIYDVIEPGPNLYDTNANANVSGLALQAAAARYSDQPADSLGVCGAGSPVSRLLPLELDPRPAGNGCFAPFTTYRSFPIEYARVFFSAEGGGTGMAITDGHGVTSYCPAGADAGKPMKVWAEVSWDTAPAIARSADYDCRPACAVVAGSLPIPRVEPVVQRAEGKAAKVGRIALAVRPRPLRVGARTRLVFTVTRRVGKRRRPVVGATVHYGGLLLRTNKRGRTTRSALYNRPGTYQVIVTKLGAHRAVSSVRVVR